MTAPPILISVVIVNHRVPFYLCQTVRSLKHAQLFDQTEVIIVDNGSNDDSHDAVIKELPEVQWIGLKDNVGFGKACNVGARQARGAYLLLLNPDTMVSENTLSACVEFMTSHPRAGIVGPKVLNADGSLQVSCRRGFPTPSVGFYHLFGFSKMFPKSKRFGRYNQTFLDPDETAQVDAVSGSFMFMPRALYRELGGFDEQFFMYGEDLDLAARVREKGYEVWYVPQTQIVHFKGRSSRKRSFRSRLAFYHAMVMFSRKYRRSSGGFFPSWFVVGGIMVQAGAGMAANVLRSFKACFIDLVIVNATLFVALVARFMLSNMGSPYHGGSAVVMATMHSLITLCYLWILAYRGVYSRERYSAMGAFSSAVLASVLFMAIIFFLRDMAFSRISVAASSVVIPALLVGWRELLPRTMAQVRRGMYSTGRVLVLGNSDATAVLIDNLEKDTTARIEGVVWPVSDGVPGHFRGHPVLGAIDETADILARTKVDLFLIATAEPWYSHVIKALSSPGVKGLTIRWVSHELCGKSRADLPEPLPLHDFSV